MLQGTALEFAQSCGITRAICVECGQHASPAAVQAAKLCIQHFTGGPRRAHGQPCAVTIVGAELVRPGFRWAQLRATCAAHDRLLQTLC